MLIALSGAQCTGKTTLLNALRSDEKFNSNFVFVDEIVRSIQKRGFKINEAGTDETQRVVMETHEQNAQLEGNVLLDRCALDCMAYTIWMWRHHKITRETYNYCYKTFIDIIMKYDIIFYLSPEFDIIPDGTRSTDEKFRNEVVEIFEQLIREFSLTVVKLTGTVEERLCAMKKILNIK